MLVTFCFENRVEPINTLCGRSAESYNAEYVINRPIVTTVF
jgi:hypothetical protein